MRVTWMLDRCEGENREIQTRLEYVRRSWLTPSTFERRNETVKYYVEKY